ncbi:unnamed protein product [Brassica rapa]|uniref:Pyrophosphate--fructose 6-phosphate 1-phosphotransferase subunit beta n=1 Tax=Brassica campestris TaxID=3711 RepID=A0A8D9D3Z4_BRACM|nr:unnamed protein product [Brassica rapa]
MAPSLAAVNRDLAAASPDNAPAKGRASVYSEVQSSRINNALPLPSVLKGAFKIVEGPASSAAGNPDEIAKLFPGLYGQPSVSVVPDQSADLSGQKLKIGVVLSGGQAPGGHNVISGLFDYLQERAKGSTFYGFKGGPAGIMKCKYVELNAEYILPYRNQGGFDMICSGRDKIETPEQFKQAEETAKKLDLDGLVVIGGDDSNTNACLLAENFRSKNLKTRVIGCPKTIDGDLKCKEVPTSFGFDTACKIYSEMIGNVMIDARSTGKYYHFVRLMGRAASHITLECALQTHPNITIIGEEVSAQKQTLKNVTDYMVDVICKRAELGYNYGVILIPEGLIDFIPEVQELIAELNEILANEVVDESGLWKKKLTEQSLKLFDLLPEAIQEQLMLERDPHGNVQVAKIETEKMLIQMVETELEKRKQAGSYKGQFMGQSHFFGYEGRCGLPTNFDATYCYALGYGAGVLLNSGKTGLISSVGNLAAPVEEWTVGGTALTALMDVERRHGKFKPVIKKAMVELEGAPFKKFASLREEWALKNRYISPGPIQFTGPDALRTEGLCPLTPEEAVLMLVALGFNRETRVFVAGAHIYGGNKRDLIKSVIQGFLPGIVLKLFIIFLPSILMVMSKFEGFVSLSSLERRAAFRYYIFNLVNVFLGSIITGSAFEQLDSFLKQSANQIPRTVGVAIPIKATFFITYIMVDGWAGVAGEILRLKPLIFFHVKNFFLVKTEKDREEAMNPGQINFHATEPRIQLYFLLGLVYAPVTPVLLPFIIIFFALAYLVFRHQIINVYNQEYESAGRFWPDVHGRIISALIISQVLLLGLMSTKGAAQSTPFLIALPVLTFFFHRFCKGRYEPAFLRHPLQEAMIKDTLEQAREPNFNLKPYLKKAYIHPVFKDDEYEDVRSEVSGYYLGDTDEECVTVPTKRQSRITTPAASHASGGSMRSPS